MYLYQFVNFTEVLYLKYIGAVDPNQRAYALSLPRNVFKCRFVPDVYSAIHHRYLHYLERLHIVINWVIVHARNLLSDQPLTRFRLIGWTPSFIFAPSGYYSRHCEHVVLWESGRTIS